jgi:hypothetical protein
MADVGPTRFQAQPFDLMFVDEADLSSIVLVPLSVLFSHLGCGPAIESDGLNLGHVVALVRPAIAPVPSGRGFALYVSRRLTGHRFRRWI